MEKLLAGSGRVMSTANRAGDQPAARVSSWRSPPRDGDNAFKEDAAHLLHDEARALDGDRPADAKAFSARLARLISRGVRVGGEELTASPERDARHQSPFGNILSLLFSRPVEHKFFPIKPTYGRILGCA